MFDSDSLSGYISLVITVTSKDPKRTVDYEAFLMSGNEAQGGQPSWSMDVNGTSFLREPTGDIMVKSRFSANHGWKFSQWFSQL